MTVEGNWGEFMVQAREAGQFIDVTLVAGGRHVKPHKVVLVGLSPYLNGLLTSGLADSASKAQELTLSGCDHVGKELGR